MLFRNLFLVVAIVSLVAFAAGCGGSSQDDNGNTATTETATATPPESTGGNDKGVGPITEFDVASLDMARVGEGAEIFKVKCTACHKLEERYIGPALTGVTKRRKPEWVLNMILNPDVMVKEDETAKALFAEFLAPMTNQNLTEEEAKLVLTYFLDNDKGLEN
jgi:cytochrome c